MKKYNLELTAATFLILDSNEASMEVKLCEAREARPGYKFDHLHFQIACEWQKCIGNTINLVSPLQCG